MARDVNRLWRQKASVGCCRCIVNLVLEGRGGGELGTGDRVQAGRIRLAEERPKAGPLDAWLLVQLLGIDSEVAFSRWVMRSSSNWKRSSRRPDGVW